MTMQLPRLALSLSLLAGALSACVDGTSTGNPHNGGPGVGEETGSDYCKKRDSEDVAPDAPTELGFSAGEVLAFVEGTHEETVTWYPQRIASYGPESGSQALTLVITRKGSPRLTHYGPDTGGAEIGVDCGPAIEVDVDVTLTTAQGALDERLSGTLQIKSALTASLFLRPDPNKLGGSFHITEVHTPGFKLVQLSLSITFTKFGTAGQLQPTFEMRSNGAVGASAGDRNPLAAWGPPACEGGKRAVPRGEKVAGFSADEVIALLDDTRNASIAFAGSAPSALTLAPFAPLDSEYVCAQLESSVFDQSSPLGTLSIRGALGVKSADGRIDGRWPLELVATPGTGGSLASNAISFDWMQQTDAVSLPSWGIHGIDVSGYDSASPNLSLTLGPSAPLSGELKVIGYKLPNCSSEPVTMPGGGVGVPGCPGSTPTELARGTVSAR
jgi:hypothetical protein